MHSQPQWPHGQRTMSLRPERMSLFFPVLLWFPATYNYHFTELHYHSYWMSRIHLEVRWCLHCAWWVTQHKQILRFFFTTFETSQFHQSGCKRAYATVFPRHLSILKHSDYTLAHTVKYPEKKQGPHYVNQKHSWPTIGALYLFMIKSRLLISWRCCKPVNRSNCDLRFVGLSNSSA